MGGGRTSEAEEEQREEEMTPVLQAKIEAMPVSKWKSELAKISDEKTRARVRDHLKTVYHFRQKEPGKRRAKREQP